MVFAFCAMLLLAAGGWSASALAGGVQKGRQQEATAVVAGTVFRDPGFSLPGAEVTLRLEGGEGKGKFKPMKMKADSRGEFAFRVPTKAAVYSVSAKASGYQEEQKSVSVEGEQRVDVFFTLFPASK